MTRQAVVGRGLGGLLAAFALVAVTATQSPAQTSQYTELTYNSAGLRIAAYLYRPPRDGPVPVVIYNHGSRAGRERDSVPFSYIGELLTPSGYAVLVPERRGYGRSDGPAFAEEVGGDLGPRFIGRMQEEAADVLAALDFLGTQPFVDRHRLGIMGWSFGGIVTIFAASRTSAFRAVIDQAGGSLTWGRSAALRDALTDAARQIRAPALLMVSQNDRTTTAVTAVAAAMKEQNPATELVVYPPFTPSHGESSGIAPGHLVFSREGSAVWAGDLRDFLRRQFGR